MRGRRERPGLAELFALPNIEAVRGVKPYGLGELIRRLRNWYAAREDSWQMVYFVVTGEVFEIDSEGRWKLCG